MQRKTMKINILLIWSLLLLAMGEVWAQPESGPISSAHIQAAGDIRITTEGPIELLMSRYYYMNAENPNMKVYRIQMANSTNRQVVYEAKSKFLQNFRDYRADVDFQQPYYKLRTGYFRERHEAYKMLKEIKENFPSAYLVHEEVEVSKLIQQQGW